MPATYLGEDPERFQRIMGVGGVIGSRPRPEKPVTKPSAGPPAAKSDQTKTDSDKG